MTFAARQVLGDCRIALELLENEVNLAKWRVHWAGAVALLRAVGHVLHKVDGALDPALKELSSTAFKSWNGGSLRHEIFREFIDKQRNEVLKEFRFNYHPLDEVVVAIVGTVVDPSSGRAHQIAQDFPLDENIYRPILDGWRAGDDARDVLSDAIDWWGAELDALDAARSRFDMPATI